MIAPQDPLDVLSVARIYLARGEMPVPIPTGQKNPVIEGWQKLKLTARDIPEYFQNGSNIGLLLGQASGNLVNIDLDCPQAVALADRFLPPTSRISGHGKTPRSHWWYRCSDLQKSFRYEFEEPDKLAKATIVEIRSTGVQTVVPPSIHPDGSRYRWYSDGEPAEIEGRRLKRVVAQLATASLLAKKFPSEHNRHKGLLAMAGVLLRGETDADAVTLILESAALASGDPGMSKRVAAGEVKRVVQDAVERLSRGDAVSGRPTFETLIPDGQRVLRKISQWLEIKEPAPGIEFPTGRNGFEVETVPWPPPLAEEAFHGLAGEMVRTIEPHTEADPAALLFQILVTFGNCIGRSAYCLVESDKHFSNLFAVLVGRTAKGRKGTSWGRTFAVYEAVDSEWARRRIQSGLSSGEGLIWEVRNPVIKRRQKENGEEEETIEDPGEMDKRLLVLEDEFASTLRVLGREGNTLSAIIRRAWDRGDLQSLVKNSKNRAEGAHISIIGHITKDELRRYMDNTEAGNGFGNRFLWVCVQRSKILPRGGNLDTATLIPLIQQLRSAVEFASQVGEVRRDDTAWAIWDAVYEDLSEGKPGLLGSIISRAEAQVLRLAMIYALLDKSQIIRQGHLRAALALWEYVEASARYIFGSALGDPIADELLSELRKVHPDGLTRTQIRDLFARNKSASQIGRALSVLSENGLVRMKPCETQGRPAETYFAIRGGTT